MMQCKAIADFSQKTTVHLQIIVGCAGCLVTWPHYLHTFLTLITFQTEIQSHVESDILKQLKRPSEISQANMKQFVKRAICVAWSLVTAVPPLISSCDKHTFHDHLHEQSSYWDYDRTNYKLKYIRPVLYMNSLGAVTLKGSVRNAEVNCIIVQFRLKNFHVKNNSCKSSFDSRKFFNG